MRLQTSVGCMGVTEEGGRVRAGKEGCDASAASQKFMLERTAAGLYKVRGQTGLQLTSQGLAVKWCAQAGKQGRV